MDRMKQISDLFIEGKEVLLGMDAQGNDVVVWVNKLNAFEREEALRDATVRRAERMAELGPDSVEGQGVAVEMSLWTDDELRDVIVGGEDDEIYLEALDNLQTDPKWRELEDFVRRAPEIQADDDISPDDPRMKTLAERSQSYTESVEAELAKVKKDHLAAYVDVGRAKLERVFGEQWRKRRAFDEFLTARRLTEIYLATRECKGKIAETSIIPGQEVIERRYDHSACDHSVKLFTERASIRRAPDQAITMIANTLNELTVNPRDAGNSVAPRSSSEPSEQSSAPEAPSTPSTPAGAHAAAPGI